MGYLHIENLYKNQDILMFRECYAMEKIHGTSAHVSYNPETDEVKFFSGGEKHERFALLFDEPALKSEFKDALEHQTTFYGEAYGGKQQGMGATYGKDLKFVVFDVKIGEHWLSVPQADQLATSLGFEFVAYRLVKTDIDTLDRERDLNSTQATRNGIDGDKIREGVVLRPIVELTTNRGSRIICKHKRAEFRERKTIPEVDPAQRELLAKASAIADEWVVPMRMDHVLDKLGNPTEMRDTGKVIAAMVEDVMREADDFIVDSKACRKAIGGAAAKMYKDRVTKIVDNRKDGS